MRTRIRTFSTFFGVHRVRPVYRSWRLCRSPSQSYGFHKILRRDSWRGRGTVTSSLRGKRKETAMDVQECTAGDREKLDVLAATEPNAKQRDRFRVVCMALDGDLTEE